MFDVQLMVEEPEDWSRLEDTRGRERREQNVRNARYEEKRFMGNERREDNPRGQGYHGNGNQQRKFQGKRYSDRRPDGHRFDDRDYYNKSMNGNGMAGNQRQGPQEYAQGGRNRQLPGRSIFRQQRLDRADRAQHANFLAGLPIP